MTCSQMVLLCLFSAILTTTMAQGAFDPCDENNHRTFPDDRLGSRNEKCRTGPVLPLCDYYLSDDWYIGENFELINHCPQSGSCGVAYPAWMNGTFPTVGEDVVHRNVCIQKYNRCCADNVEIKIKNCNSFFVYYFVHLQECSQAYCLTSNYSCDEPKAAAATTTTAPSTSTEGQTKDYIKYIIIGICLFVGIVLVGVGTIIAVVMKSGRLKRNRKISNGVSEEGNISDRPPPYDHVINTDKGKKRIV